MNQQISVGILAVVAMMCVHAGCRDHSTVSDSDAATLTGADPIHLTDSNFQKEVIEANQTVLVDMWAPWCQPCIDMKPTIRELAEELAGEIKVSELKVDDNPFIKEKYGVDRIPMLLIFKRGIEVKRLIGRKTKQELLEAIDET